MNARKAYDRTSDPDVAHAALGILHARMPAILGANLVNSSILAACFAGDVDGRLLWTWYVAILVSTAARAALWYRFRNFGPTETRAWRRAAFTGSSISGLLWGVGGLLFFVPGSAALATLTAFVLGGMAAGALAMLTADLPTFRAFVFLSLLPFALRLMWQGGEVHVAMAAMFLTYMIAILLVGPNLHASIVEALALRFENGTLLRGLEERVKVRTERHAAVADFSQRALSGLALDDVVAEAAGLVSRGMPSAGALIAQLLSDDVFLVRARSDAVGLGAGDTSFPATPDFVATRAIKFGEPVIVEDFARESTLRVCPPLSGSSVRCEVCVPIWIDGCPQGVLLAWSTKPQSVAADDVHFLRSVATTIAAAAQRRHAELDAQRLALHDPLTGLPNRALLRENLVRSLNQVARTGRRVAMLLIDLDNFKDVNDTLGHPAGDRLLVEAAGRLRAAVRREEAPARLGGDEFAVVLTDLWNADAAARVAGDVVRAFGEPFHIDGQVVQVGASVGISIFPDDASDPDHLLRNADLALYRAKARGRAGYEFYSTDMSALVEARMDLLRDLRGAVEREEFSLLFQPEIALDDGRIARLEALPRWRSRSRGHVLPNEFVPLAETNGLMPAIDNWCVSRAADQAKRWGSAAPAGLSITVNVSPGQWHRRGILPALERTLADCLREGTSIGLEISERGFPLAAETRVVECMRRLQSLGISIAIDNFGTGHLNPARLRRLPVDCIKIDSSFVGGLCREVDADVIVRSMILLGRNQGLRVVAEGVETEEQLDFLRAEGCGFAQGDLVAPPIPADAVPEILSTGWRRSLGAPEMPQV